MTPLIANRSGPITGRIRVPGDKSISHRALMVSAIAVGRTVISGLLEGEDVLRTAAAMRVLGATAVREGPGSWSVEGVGVGGLCEPGDVLDLGNSGTGARLLMGLVATHPFTAILTGDASLRSRPMGRVATPLERMGARILMRPGGLMPLTVLGAENPVPIRHRLAVPSAQVKSAILLAGLNAPGETTVIETEPTRDHTETMLRHFGATVRIEEASEEGHPAAKAITVAGYPEIAARDIAVPGDPSSAAFAAVAALLTPDSRLTIENVGTNPLRFGLYQTLKEMGADIVLSAERREAGEGVADITVQASHLRGVDVPPERAPTMIDEYPILAVAAACAEGVTRMEGLAELRIKESDRLRAMAEGLEACGARVEMTHDGLTVHGTGARPKGGATVTTSFDHRVAMAFLVLGGVSAEPVIVDDSESIATSFPGFAALMNGIGARIGARIGPQIGAQIGPRQD
ncbi:MAG: 3-phosphoshikimate 1-carboxyvinyltransferase [Alphaproteobacteria bacterium]